MSSVKNNNFIKKKHFFLKKSLFYIIFYKIFIFLLFFIFFLFFYNFLSIHAKFIESLNLESIFFSSAQSNPSTDLLETPFTPSTEPSSNPDPATH